MPKAQDIATWQPLSIGAQIAEIEREIAMREDVYPRLVASNKLRQHEADYQMNAIRSALATLRWVQKHRERLRQFASETREGAPT